MSKKPVKTVECPRCSGHKIFQEYLHVRDGVCFRCNGTGRVPFKTVFDTFTSVKQLLDEAEKVRITDKYGFLTAQMSLKEGLKSLASHGIRAWLSNKKLHVYNFSHRDY